MLPAVNASKAIRPPNTVRRAKANQRAGKNRDKLLAVGAKLFAEKGITTVSVEQILGQAGVSRATFYGFFENKNELAAAILLPVFDTGHQKLVALLEAEPRAAANGLIDMYIDLWQQHPAALLLMADLDAGIFRYVRTRHDAFNDALMKVIDRIDSGGLLRHDSVKLTVDVIAITAIPLLRAYRNTVDMEALYREFMLALLIKQ